MKKYTLAILTSFAIGGMALAQSFVPQYQYDSRILVLNQDIGPSNVVTSITGFTLNPFSAPGVAGVIDLHGTTTSFDVFYKVANHNITADTNGNLILTWYPGYKIGAYTITNGPTTAYTNYSVSGGYIWCTNSLVTNTIAVVTATTLTNEVDGRFSIAINTNQFGNADVARLVSLQNGSTNSADDWDVTVGFGLYH
jgi:hypothetical protein